MVLKIAFAIGVALFMLRMGIAVLRALATPIPEPPPVGELRKVKLQYRCSLCGTEVRMTVATEEAPDPPRHCMDDMELQQTEDL
ncbi:MAG: hypothetical protein VX752_08080 [Actinomycetota bacterium]|jgi:DNA-directed RNA polymerase subunit RPC12/RpoP|nr:hypothetical protein [Actinomycetota bacterium]